MVLSFAWISLSSNVVLWYSTLLWKLLSERSKRTCRTCCICNSSFDMYCCWDHRCCCSSTDIVQHAPNLFHCLDTHLWKAQVVGKAERKYIKFPLSDCKLQGKHNVVVHQVNHLDR